MKKKRFVLINLITLLTACNTAQESINNPSSQTPMPTSTSNSQTPISPKPIPTSTSNLPTDTGDSTSENEIVLTSSQQLILPSGPIFSDSDKVAIFHFDHQLSLLDPFTKQTKKINTPQTLKNLRFASSANMEKAIFIGDDFSVSSPDTNLPQGIKVYEVEGEKFNEKSFGGYRLLSTRIDQDGNGIALLSNEQFLKRSNIEQSRKEKISLFKVSIQNYTLSSSITSLGATELNNIGMQVLQTGDLNTSGEGYALYQNRVQNTYSQIPIVNNGLREEETIIALLKSPVIFPSRSFSAFLVWEEREETKSTLFVAPKEGPKPVSTPIAFALESMITERKNIGGAEILFEDTQTWDVKLDESGNGYIAWLSTQKSENNKDYLSISKITNFKKEKAKAIFFDDNEKGFGVRLSQSRESADILASVLIASCSLERCINNTISSDSKVSIQTFKTAE